MKQKITKALLERFYRGACTKEERELVWKWLQSPESKDEVDEAMKQHWQKLAGMHKLPETDFDALYEGIYANLDTRPPARSRRFPVAMKVAATVTGLLLIAAIAFYRLILVDNDVMQITGYGESKEVVLPDQSVITLNTNSTLEYAKDWDDQNREVWLNGEAYFSITHLEKNQKFVVHTNDVSIKVLGTEFNVHHRRGDTKVVLNSGKVALNIAKSNDTTIIMSPGELVEYSASSDEIITKIVDPEAHSSWRNKRLTFDKTKLYEIQRILEDDYGLNVVFEDSAQRNRELSGAISIENVDVFLDGISESLDLSISRLNNKVVFEK